MKKEHLTRKAFAEFSGVSAFTLRNLLDNKTQLKNEILLELKKPHYEQYGSVEMID